MDAIDCLYDIIRRMDHQTQAYSALVNEMHHLNEQIAVLVEKLSESSGNQEVDDQEETKN